MIGFPKLSMYKYIPGLLKHHYSIIWVEQDETEDTRRTGKVRKKTRVFTPGTLFEDPLTQDDYHICCIHSLSINTHYVVVIDTSTGKVELVNLDETKNLKWFSCIYKPYEVLCLCDEKLFSEISPFWATKAVYLKDVNSHQEYFTKSFQNKTIESTFSNTRAIKDIPIQYLPSLTCLVSFIRACHEKAVDRLSFPSDRNRHTMVLHNNAIHQLDVVQTMRGDGLFSILNKTSTPMGSRLLSKQLSNPMTNVDEIRAMYDNVSEMIPNITKVTSILKGVPDLDRKVKKLNNGSLTIQELVSLFKVFQNMLALYPYDDCIVKHVQHIETCLTSAIDVENECFIHPPELVQQRRVMDSIASNIEKYIKQLTNGVDFELRVDLLSSTVSTTPKRAQRLQDVIRIRKKKTTTVDVTNTTIEQYFHDYHYEKESYDTLYRKTLQAFQLEWYESCSNEMKHISKVVAETDAIKARAVCAKEYKYTRPNIDPQEVSFVKGELIRHPIIETQDNINYIANDVSLDKGILLYGINGAGKSSFGRAVALNLIMAQAGFFVPAKSFTYSPYERIYTRIGCDDNLYEGMSSFWLEITEMNGIIRSGDKKSLVIGDELFKGTEDVSAMALVSACLHWLTTNQVSFIFATHLHKLPQIQLVSKLDLRIMHMRSEYCKRSKSIVFNRKWCEGQGESNYGIEVAEYLLDDTTIIINAKLVRNELLRTSKSWKRSRYNANVYLDECQNCKSTENLHTHHIQPQKEEVNNKSSNLIPLCENCHKKLHANMLEHEMIDTVHGIFHIFNERP